MGAPRSSDRPESAIAPPGTFLGYRATRPWLWLVDVEQRTLGAPATTLPGNRLAVSEIAPRTGWLAIHTHQQVCAPMLDVTWMVGRVSTG